MRRLAVPCLVSLLWSTGAAAGGDDWLFRVNVKASPNGCALIDPQPIEVGDHFPTSCKKLIVTACYSWGWWRLNKPASRDEYNQALGFLRHAESASTPVRFGLMGEGLGDIVLGSECHASSSALQIVDDRAVYSFSKWP